MNTKYIRIENCGGYQNITTVDAQGNYLQRAVWPDGIETSRNSTTIYKMGWTSLSEFLKHRPHFKAVQ